MWRIRSSASLRSRMSRTASTRLLAVALAEGAGQDLGRDQRAVDMLELDLAGRLDVIGHVFAQDRPAGVGDAVHDVAADQRFRGTCP